MPRYRMALDVAVGPRQEGTHGAPPAPAFFRTVTVDLNPVGLCLLSDVAYPVGAALSCSLAVPGHPQPIEAVGRLVWCQRLDGADSSYRVGVEFTDLAAAHRATLIAFLERPSAPQRATAKRVLLADGNDELRQALKLRFESSGFEVLTAFDGLEALRKSRAQQPHLIVMRLTLPNLNGVEVCRLLHREKPSAQIPVILFAARTRRHDAERCRKAGAAAFLAVPFNGEALLAKVGALLAEPPA